jgi:orotidine-5'-phosphate decarboxylase
MEAKDRIIVMLDHQDLNNLDTLVPSLVPYIGCFQLGQDLLMMLDPKPVIQKIQSYGGRVFYDTKLCNQPKIVAEVARNLVELEVNAFSVHASCGAKGIEAAVAKRGRAMKGETKIFIETILPLLSAKDIWDIGYPAKWPCVQSFGQYDAKQYIPDLIDQMARQAYSAGADGFICAAADWKRKLVKSSETHKLAKIFTMVVPSWMIKTPYEEVFVHNGCITPAEALRIGATAFILSYSITRPPNEIGTPADAAQLVIRELESVKLPLCDGCNVRSPHEHRCHGTTYVARTSVQCGCSSPTCEPFFWDLSSPLLTRL